MTAKHFNSDKKENPQSYGLGWAWKMFAQKYFPGVFFNDYVLKSAITRTSGIIKAKKSYSSA